MTTALKDHQMDFVHTRLWAKAFGESSNSQYTAAAERLRASYRRFWSNACDLSSQIAKDLPGLTLHDSRHFEALWDRADQIAGADLPLTPLEVYVFGGAVLLHDAGNSANAFHGGLAEISSTPEWRDSLALLGVDPSVDVGELTSSVREDALLRTLRGIHARRAESLGELAFRNSVTKEVCHLIEDDTLRTHLGPIIGKIAASHHWNVDDLDSKLQHNVGAPAGFPSQWTVRPILIASLLRCSDAVQLDQNRAPDFLMSLLNIRGVSELHWRAQNLLMAPLVDPNDGRSLIFSSSRSYREEDADAWWIAYDAIRLAHGELQSCGLLLNDLRLPAFAVDRIRNAESPLRLSSTVRTSGWRPVSAEVKANRVSRIIEMFGGNQLYGQEYVVALREVIQNSMDAVSNRRALEPINSDYQGSITVHLVPEPTSEGAWLVVEDDGIGMSEGVLTGALIDFGDSYIASRLAQEERPGLSAAASRRIGRFGVGFFSVFMLGNRIVVTSRPYDASLKDVRSLMFREGLTLRPLLLDRPVDDFAAQISTRVSIFISKDSLNKLLNPPWAQQHNELTVTFEQLVKGLCPYSEVDIFLKDSEGSRRLVRSGSWPPADALAWLREVTLADARQEPYLDQALNWAVPRLRPLDPEEPSSGLAAISVSGGPAGVGTIGGLRVGTRWGSYSEWYVGTVDHEPEGPDRTGGAFRAQNRLPAWASEQAQLVSTADLDNPSKIRAAIRVAQRGGDALPVAGAMMGGAPVLVGQIVEFLSTGERLAMILQGERFGRGDEDNRIVFTGLRLEQFSPFMSYFRPEEVERIVHLLEPFEDTSGREFWVISSESPAPAGTFFDCLIREVRSRGLYFNIDFQELAVARYIGASSQRDNLEHGQEILRHVAVITTSAAPCTGSWLD